MALGARGGSLAEKAGSPHVARAGQFFGRRGRVLPTSKQSGRGLGSRPRLFYAPGRSTSALSTPNFSKYGSDGQWSTHLLAPILLDLAENTTAGSYEGRGTMLRPSLSCASHSPVRQKARSSGPDGPGDAPAGGWRSVFVCSTPTQRSGIPVGTMCLVRRGLGCWTGAERRAGEAVEPGP